LGPGNASAHPGIRLAVLEWNLSRTYDWRAGLHAAGSLILYESLTPELTMTAPALLMRNTTNDPTWTAFIYHDHVSWFPGGGYVVEKLFREHFAETYLASTSGTFRDIGNRASFFADISPMKPEAWQPGTVDAIATASADGRRVIVKAVNYSGTPNALLIHLQGSRVPSAATVMVYTVTAGLHDAASLAQPDRIKARRTDPGLPPRSDNRSRTVYGRRRRDFGQLAPISAVRASARRRRSPARYR
jgi:alpha-N-arabinofuranosidase